MTRIPVASPSSCPVFPHEVFAAIIDKSARDTIKTVRRSIPFLGRWSMKLLFSRVSLTINTLDLAASERLRFLSGLPEDWIWDLEIRFQGSDLVDQESVGLLCKVVRGTSLQELCLINAPSAIGKALLAAREGVRYRARPNTLYIVMHPPAAGATSLEIQYVAFRDVLSSWELTSVCQTRWLAGSCPGDVAGPETAPGQRRMGQLARSPSSGSDASPCRRWRSR